MCPPLHCYFHPGNFPLSSVGSPQPRLTQGACPSALHSLLHPWVHARLLAGREWTGLLVAGHPSSPGSGTPGLDVVPEVQGAGQPQAPGRATAALWHKGQIGSLLPGAVPMLVAMHGALTPPHAYSRGSWATVPCPIPPRHLCPCLGKGVSLGPADVGWDDREPAWCWGCPAVPQPSLVPAPAVLDSCASTLLSPELLGRGQVGPNPTAHPFPPHGG